jgi:hypothetical protein
MRVDPAVVVTTKLSLRQAPLAASTTQHLPEQSSEDIRLAFG